MIRLAAALCLSLVASGAQAEPQCRIEWGKKICDESAAASAEIDTKPNYRDMSDAHKDAISVKFGITAGPDERRRMGNVVAVLSTKNGVPRAELWSCLYHFERDKLRLSLPDAAALCASMMAAQ